MQSSEVDFQEIAMKTDALLFINPHVILKPCETIGGQLMHFNKDFYCVEIHDHEVACDGILYNNVFEIPFISLNEEQSVEIQKIISDIQSELGNEDSSTEEMLRTLLKLIILKSTRIWKQQHQLSDSVQQADVQFCGNSANWLNSILKRITLWPTMLTCSVLHQRTSAKK